MAQSDLNPDLKRLNLLGGFQKLVNNVRNLVLPKKVFSLKKNWQDGNFRSFECEH